MLKVGPEQREKIAEYWGLNQPTGAIFALVICVVKGDIGTSMVYRCPVSEI